MLSSLSDEEASFLFYSWDFWARDEQRAPTDPDWLTWLILAGRGFGKTRSGAEWVNELMTSGHYGHMALVADDAADARDIMVDGESGILACAPPWNKPKYEPSKKRLTWPNGARALIFSADDPESLRGPQHDCAWLDEMCKWRYQQEAYDQLQFGLRLGKRPIQCITTTPKPTKLLKSIIARKSTRITKGSTYDNLMNMAPTFREAIVGKYEGTRLGRQELFAEILDDNPNAIFSMALVEQYRHHLTKVMSDGSAVENPFPELVRKVVAVDPPITANPKSDECGIVVSGKTAGNGRVGSEHYYILGDRSVQGKSPEGWATQAIRAYHTFEADAIVAEVNQGGDMVQSVINSIDANIRVIKVHATRGKTKRAEPIAGLYEQGRVHHVGTMGTLEDQMCDWDPSLGDNQDSPDRMDALVWGVTNLMGSTQSEPSIRSL